MSDNQYSRRKKRKKPRYDRLIVAFLIMLCAIGFVGVMIHNLLSNHAQASGAQTKTTMSQQSQPKSSEKNKANQQDKNLPKSKKTDWDLVLVNRKNRKDELNPDVTQLNNIFVDTRIADAATQFLAAAQAINPAEHFISGYRSVDYQTTLYNQYVDQEMAADPSLDRAAAETKVQTYSQPAGSSEHQTGLAIDLSDVDSLNESTTAKEVAAIAPTYGFVLRFPEDGTPSTGVGYEDWHFRYVGVENAKYMTENHLTLEQFLKLLK